MGSSADRAWQLSQLVEGVSTAFNPSHGSLSCVKTNCVSFASAQARKLNRSVCFSFPHEVSYFVGTPTMAGHCVSKQIGRHDAACQGCPRCVSRSPVLGTPQSRRALWGEEQRRSDCAFVLARKRKIRSLLRRGRRARRARFPTCGVIRVAGIYFSRFSEGRFESPHYPSRKNGPLITTKSEIFKIFFQSR